MVERLVKMAQRTLEAVKYNMWECIVCIIVLGIAFPMAANFLLAAIVQFLCHELHIGMFTGQTQSYLIQHAVCYCM